MLLQKNVSPIKSLCQPFLVVLLLLIPWLLVRILLGLSFGFEFADIRGMLSDFILVVALSLFLVLFGKSYINKILILLLYGVFLLTSVSNYEHILALNAAFSFRDMYHLTDANFLSGSVAFSTASIVVFVLSALVLLGAFLFARTIFVVQFKPLLLLLVTLVLLFLAIDKKYDIESWRQSNVIVDNVAYEFRLANKQLSKGDAGSSPSANKLWQEISSADLSGEKRYRGDKKNVLVILIEGLSGHYVYRDRDAEPYLDDVQMPKLAKRAESALSYTNFYAPQVQTNRGEYALLCGDLPNIASHAPKMPIVQNIQSHLGRECLPQRLQDKGYLTSYLQAASLSFMDKDKFMPAAGYQRTAGKEWFRQPFLNHAWGLADRDFFTQSLREVDHLEAQEHPWMLTLLTVGTHHPYTIPAESKIEGMHPFHNAVQHVDDELDKYLHELAERGVLDDTLVIISSDESQGSKKDKTLLSKNWVPMVIIDDSLPVKQVTQPFMQTDLPLSVMDYLDLLDDTDTYQGRSIFREYQSERPLIFGLFHDKRAYYLDESSLLTSCDYSLTECFASQFANQRIFDQLHSKKDVPVSEDKVADLSYVIRESDWTFERFKRSEDVLDGITPWIGQYFTSKNFQGKQYVRQDEAVNFNWGNGAPVTGFPSVDFSVRWASCLIVEQEQDYTISLVANEGAKVLVDDEVIVDHWRKMTNKQKAYQKQFSPGTHLIRVEYYEGYYSASINLTLVDQEKTPAKFVQPVKTADGVFVCQ